MYGIKVCLIATTASFRDPGSQTFHDTLPLPPPSTLAGIAGAALGLRYKDTIMFFKKNHIHVGCSGYSNGTAKDLWRYTKIKSGNNLEKDILVRYFHHQFTASLYYACDDLNIANKVYDAFCNPYYALSVGNNDDIACIKFVKIYNDVKKGFSSNVNGECMVFGSSIEYVKVRWENVKNIPLNVVIKPAISKKIPVDFEFKGPDEIRTAVKFIDVLYLNNNIYLEDSVQTITFDSISIPYYAF